MTIVGPIGPVDHESEVGRGKARPGWRVGQRVRARVLRKLPDGRYLVQSDDGEWVAESEVDLSEADVIYGRVVAMEPVPRIRVGGGGEEEASSRENNRELPLVRAWLLLNGRPVELHSLYRKEVGRGRKKAGVHRLLLYLQDSVLGPLGIELTLNGRYATVEVRCESLELAEMLQGRSSELEKALNLDKMLLANFSVSLWDREPSSVWQALEMSPGYESVDWVT